MVSKWKRFYSVLALFVLAPCSLAQSVTTIENMGTVTATTMSNGLGFNVNPGNDWELQYAAQAGAKEVRMQCAWISTEIQTAQNTSGGYALPAACVSGFASAAKYNLHPLVIAAYGPPYHPIVTLQTTAAVPVGSYTIPVSVVSGSLSQINVPYCHVIEQNGTQITALGYNAYEGALITAVNSTAGTLSLSAKTSVAIASGTMLTINQLLYPSVATSDPTDPSISAYAGPAGAGFGGYVGFLAKSIASAGLTGRVEIWNEPTWAHDPWDQRFHFYDANIPSNLSQSLDQSGFVGALELQTPPPGVRYEWGGSHKSGFNSILGPRNPHPTQVQAAASLGSESFHPYGNDPEDGGWDPTCLALLNGWGQCILQGLDPADNFKAAVQYNLQNVASYGWGISQGITETGTSTGDQNGKARFIMREYAMYMALGLQWIDFFQLATPQPGYGFVDSSTTPGTVLQPYLAIKGFMSDLGAITGQAAPKFTTANMPTVTNYSGYYNLAVVHVTGTTSATVGSNPQLFIAWQRSIVANQTLSWLTMNSPAAVPLTIQLPAGTKASAATNLTNRTAVAFTQTGTTVTFMVADDPVSLLVVPVPTLTMSSAASSMTVSSGATQSNTNVLTLTASGGLNTTATLSCSIAYAGQGGASVMPSCVIPNPNVVLTDGITQTATLTILSTAAQAQMKPTGSFREMSGVSYGTMLAFVAPLAGILAVRRRKVTSLAAVMLCVAALGALGGCASSSPTDAMKPTIPGTTKGTYNVTVKATGNNAASNVTASTSITVTIE